MSARAFSAQMRAMIEDLKSQGTAAIYCDNLISYLRQVETDPEPEPSAEDMERYKANLQDWIDSNRHERDGTLEMFRSVIASGQMAIRSSLLLNGGAAVALLAFVGHLAQFNPPKVPEFSSCIVPFTYGVLAMGIVSGLTYLSQWFYANDSAASQRVGYALNIACIILGLASYGCFAWGLYSAQFAFENFA